MPYLKVAVTYKSGATMQRDLDSLREGNAQFNNR